MKKSVILFGEFLFNFSQKLYLFVIKQEKKHTNQKKKNL